ncbi:hypothetical protein [Comamonas aquatica]|jgi:hypothetical protein|uniref:hypothetical protein n=1 Tax=Comamonas aquatica TaxID=225991 RepID=UPI003D076930
MKSNADRIFYLIPKHRADGQTIDLYLPSDLVTQENREIEPSLGFGVFTFLRSVQNRGKPRSLSFPAVLGFGENSQIVELTLQSEYLNNWSRRSNRFSFEQDDTAKRLNISVSFIARKFPPHFKLAGTAEKLSSYSLWALVPENREYLESLWIARNFYLTGHGEMGDNRDASNG